MAPRVAEVKGLDQYPERDWPTNIPLLYFAYHIMAGLGTIFAACDGALRLSPLARIALPHALDAVDPDARPSRSRTSPTPPAGLPRKWAASPGWSMDCCAPRTVIPRMYRPRTAYSRCSASWESTRCSRCSCCSSSCGTSMRVPAPRPRRMTTTSRPPSREEPPRPSLWRPSGLYSSH